MVDAIQASPSYFPRLASQASAAKSDVASETSAPVTDRTARDTLQIGSVGQKHINLARSAELARELPDATDRAAFDAALDRAQEDVRRITDLFGAVLGELNGNAATANTADQTGDTTKLGSGETVVNLGEVQRLARRVETGELSPGDFVDVLRNAIRDVGRITGLFTETVKASFSHDHRV